MKILVSLLSSILLLSSVAEANVQKAFLTLAHDQDKMAQLDLEISSALFDHLRGGGNVVGFQLEDASGNTIYGNDVFLDTGFFTGAPNTQMAMIKIFDESRLDSEGIVNFFTKIKEMTMVFYGYKTGSPVETGRLSFGPICSANKVRNLSGADGCNITTEDVTGIPIDSGICEDSKELADVADTACKSDSIKASLEKIYNCTFTCE